MAARSPSGGDPASTLTVSAAGGRGTPAAPRFESGHDTESIPQPADNPREPMPGRIATQCARLAESPWFQGAIVAVILANAAVIGMETYDSLDREQGALLDTLNDVFLAVFTVEIAIRLTAYGRRPQGFFKSGWNTFDFLVVALAFLPWVRQSVTLLRLARLLRVARLVSVMPGLRIVIAAIARSLAPIASLLVLNFFLLYLYGMLGWILYADHDPERFGTIGDALLTLFQVLTLEGWNEVLATEMKLSSWSWVYFVSFVLVGTFVILNVVIAVIVNSMEEVHTIEEKRELAKIALAARDPEARLELHERVKVLRAALDYLERDLLGGTGRGRT
jgi:voltage-gated sodium channel